MIPNDLSTFTVEQLRGFASLVDSEIATLRAKFDAADGTRDAADVSRFSELADTKVRIADAIQAALDADGAADAVDEAVAEGDAEATTEDDGEGDSDSDADGDGSGDADPDTAVEEAVASATMGGGTGPRVTREHLRTFTPDDVRSFLRTNTGSRLAAGSRVSFATLNRRTNHEITRNADITDLLPSIVADRASGEDRTAAGCFCGPDDARDAIHRSLVSDRPLSDTLPTVTGGDFRFIRQIDLAAARTGVSIWDCDDQAAVDPDSIGTWKPCFDLDCQTEVTSETYGVPACATFDTQAMIGNPNLIDNLEHVMTVAYNEAAELEVYARLLAQASQYNFNAFAPLVGYGASAKLLKSVAWAMEKIRANHRDRLPYTLAVPAGLRERILSDGFIRASDDYRTWDDVVTRLNELGVDRIVELVDPTAATTALAAPGGPPVAAPANTLAQTVLLYRPDNFLLGVGPEIDMGIVAAGPDQLRQNKMHWFTESFESVTRIGIQPTVALTGDFCDSGIRPAYGEGYVCA